MGGKGGDRKSYKATSSAKAAEALAAKGGTAGFGGCVHAWWSLHCLHGVAVEAQLVNLGSITATHILLEWVLCRFGGIRPTAGFGFGAPAAATVPSSGSASAESSEVSAQLDGDLAQCLRHLSKKDTTTKMKALQVLEQ